MNFEGKCAIKLVHGLEGVGGAGGNLGQILLGMCFWPLRAPTPLQSILWPIVD